MLHEHFDCIAIWTVPFVLNPFFAVDYMCHGCINPKGFDLETQLVGLFEFPACVLFHCQPTNQIIWFRCSKRRVWFNEGVNYKYAIGWPLFDSFVHVICSCSSNLFLNLPNSFLIHFNSKNSDFFCIMSMRVSSIWLWFLINFPLAGF